MPTTVTTSKIDQWFTKHLTKKAERILHGTPVLYSFAAKYPLPGGKGSTLIVPKKVAADAATIAALSETTAVTKRAVTGGSYTATVAGYGDAVEYSDFLDLINETPDMLVADVEEMTQGAADKIDDLLATELSENGEFLEPDGTTGAGSVTATTPLTQGFFFRAAAKLRQRKVQAYPDGYYWAVVSPTQEHDLFINTTVSGAAGDNFVLGAGYMELTDVGAERLKMAHIGHIGGCRVFSSAVSARAIDGTHADMAASNDGYEAFVMGQKALGAVDLKTARLRVYRKGLGSAGTEDPIDQFMTVGVKFYFAGMGMRIADPASLGSDHESFAALIRTASGANTI